VNKKQLAGLFLCNFGPFVVGSGALPLLPVYAAALGAPPIVTGYYLAVAYLGLTAGTFAAGWVSDRIYRRRALLVAGALVGIPTLWWVGRMDQVWALVVLTGFVWFVGGFSIALTQIVTGLTAPREARGQVYGLLALASGLGGLTGGLLTGPIVDRWGYPTMFAVLALFLALWLVGAPLLGPGADVPTRSTETATRSGTRLGPSYALLFAASLVSAVAGFVSMLGRSMSMNALGLTATAISSTGAIGSAAGLPLPLLVGRWSDRVGRTRFLLLSYLASTAGIVLLALSTSLWHFWVAVVVGTVGSITSTTVGPALVTDLVPRDALGRGMSLYSATGWIGAVIGFAGTGHAVQAMGMLPTLVAAAALPLISIALLLPVHRARTAAGLSTEQA
jgi:DHA1 family multidrug resistance protein-like MFS transporter